MSRFLTDTAHVSPLTNDSKAALASPLPDHVTGRGWVGAGWEGLVPGTRSGPGRPALAEGLSPQAGGGGGTQGRSPKTG